MSIAEERLHRVKDQSLDEKILLHLYRLKITDPDRRDFIYVQIESLQAKKMLSRGIPPDTDDYNIHQFNLQRDIENVESWISSSAVKATSLAEARDITSVATAEKKRPYFIVYLLSLLFIFLATLFGLAATTEYTNTFVLPIEKKSVSETDGSTVDVPANERGIAIFPKQGITDPSGVDISVFVAISGSLLAAINGKRMFIEVTAKGNNDNPSREFAIAYATPDAGNSGWHKFSLSPEFRTVTMSYKIPLRTGETEADYFCIGVDTSGEGKGLVLKDIRFFVVNSPFSWLWAKLTKENYFG